MSHALRLNGAGEEPLRAPLSHALRLNGVGEVLVRGSDLTPSPLECFPHFARLFAAAGRPLGPRASEIADVGTVQGLSLNFLTLLDYLQRREDRSAPVPARLQTWERLPRCLTLLTFHWTTDCSGFVGPHDPHPKQAFGTSHRRMT